MAEAIPDMPPGTLGFRVAGHLTRDDYANVLVPPLREAVEAGRPLRVLYAVGPELDMDRSALWEDARLNLDLGIRHRRAWERVAVVTDADWLRRAFELFSWMVPGQMRLFAESELEQAKAWVAEQPS